MRTWNTEWPESPLGSGWEESVTMPKPQPKVRAISVKQAIFYAKLHNKEPDSSVRPMIHFQGWLRYQFKLPEEKITEISAQLNKIKPGNTEGIAKLIQHAIKQVT